MLPNRNAPFAGTPDRVVSCAITTVRGQSAGAVVALARLGADFVQLRDKEATDREFETLLDALQRSAPDVLSRVVVNDRLAAAASFPVAGVHLPEAGLPVRAVRRHFPRGRMLLGRSIHRLEQVEAESDAGADYLILGPVAATGDKTPLPSGLLRDACQSARVPVWAVGGLTPENLTGLAGVRVSGVAAIRSFADPEAGAAFVRATKEVFGS